jgi:hypothetical protein
VQVRARKGYWALTAEETATALAPPKPAPPAAVTNALGSIAEPSRGRVVRTWVGMSRADSGKTRVSFVWEPLPPVQGLDKQDAARVSLTAVGPDGTPLFRGRVPEQDAPATATNGVAGTDSAPAATTGGAAAKTRGPAQVHFDVPPGRIQMRASIEGPDGRMLDSMVQEIVVPDYTAPTLALGTPVVLRARNALEFRTLSTDPQAVPTPTREFRRTDRLLIRIGAYAPGNAVPSVAARLLNRGGTKMADLPVTAAGGVHQIDLPLASLAPGEYLVEIAAKLDAGDAKELVAFKVSS